MLTCLPCPALPCCPLQISVPVIHHITFADGSAHDDIVLTSGKRCAALRCLGACLTCLPAAGVGCVLWCAGARDPSPAAAVLRLLTHPAPTQRPPLPHPQAA